MIRRLAICTLALALVAAGCGDDDDEATTAETTATTAAETETETETEDATEDGSGSATAAGADGTLAVSSTDLGDILVVGDRTVYVFDPDEQSGDSSCYDQCEANWPPVGEVAAGEGVDESLLGTTTREDGSVQATYDDWPLYLFSNDVAPGDVNGQAVGDVWWVIDPSGEPIRDAA